MPHVPYGYTIQDGKAVIDQLQAEQLKKLFKAYLSGLSLKDAAKKAGIVRYHATIANMLTNKRYLGDDYYPKIIDEDTFEKVEAEKLRRAQMLGRIWEHKPKENSIKKYQFAMPTPDELYDDPFKQAEYVYSLIESEAIDNDDE
ncbi:MAG: recombinase family protein [Sulfurimonas sp.]|jgi:hypothetical protein|uniref:Recombinase family protein n=2 Tax=Bacillota TaxID=1239 RepID=A0A9X2MHF6_9FIRM|nr:MULTISPECIES: recombinase family protein [Bacillota]MCK9436926.1 recombinase family protein [Synergistaceae bacterium]MCW1713979.1 recombinase family protein [Synergistaceae bacterium DZ-S4]MDD3106006.1 recombinase [Bacteroidales bacterium]EGT3735442.1 recombinase [Clostridioides difficile]EGT3739078.1 recombinase [Clostridioides difficile]